MVAEVDDGIGGLGDFGLACGAVLFQPLDFGGVSFGLARQLFLLFLQRHGPSGGFGEPLFGLKRAGAPFALFASRSSVAFAVGSVLGLPFGEEALAGVLEWYSVIHMLPAGLPLVLTEAARVLRPGGHVLVGFQSGTGTRDVSAAYRRFGHEIRLRRHLHMPEQVAADLRAAGLREEARLVRRPRGAETEDQAFLLAAKPSR